MCKIATHDNGNEDDNENEYGDDDNNNTVKSTFTHTNN